MCRPVASDGLACRASSLGQFQLGIELGQEEFLVEADRLRVRAYLSALVEGGGQKGEIVLFERFEMPLRKLGLPRNLLERQPPTFTSASQQLTNARRLTLIRSRTGIDRGHDPGSFDELTSQPYYPRFRAMVRRSGQFPTRAETPSPLARRLANGV